MYSTINHEEALIIFKNGYLVYQNGGDEWEDCPYYDPDKTYTKERQDKQCAWQTGYNFAKQIDHNE